MTYFLGPPGGVPRSKSGTASVKQGVPSSESSSPPPPLPLTRPRSSPPRCTGRLEIRTGPTAEMDFRHSTATRRRLGWRSPTNAERRTAGGARGNGPPTWTELSFAASESCSPDPYRQHHEAHPAPTRDGSSSLQRLRVGELLSRQTAHGAMPFARVPACGTGSCHLCSCAFCFLERGIIPSSFREALLLRALRAPDGRRQRPRGAL